MNNKAQKSPEIDLLVLVNVLWSKKWFIVRIAAIAMVIGLLFSLGIPREYTCIVKMAPEENKTNVSGNISGLAAMAGIDIGTNNDGLNTNIYPDLVQSIPFLTELMNVRISSQCSYTGRTFYEYMDRGLKKPWWSVVLNSPFKLLSLIKGEASTTGKPDQFNMKRGEEDNYTDLRKRITVTIDKKTGVITAGLTLQDRVLSAVIADTLVDRLQNYITDYRTGKAKKDLDFATRMFNDAKDKYYKAQNKYAGYVDANRNVALESVKIEQERLKNEQILAYNVYSSLAQQVEMAQMKVQEKTPCVTVIEPARVPVNRSNTGRIIIILLFGILGIISSTVKVVYNKWEEIIVR